MPSYRLYRLDGAGKIMSAEWIEAESDDAACDHARNNGKSPAIEPWDQDRLVIRIESGRELPGG